MKVDRKYIYKDTTGNEEDEGKVFDKDDLQSAYFYGRQLAIMSGVDKLACKESTVKSLTLLATKPLTDIPNVFSDSTDIVEPQPNDPCSTLAVAALCEAMRLDNLVMIVRYVARNNATPKLAVLTPMEYHGVQCFQMRYMPFYEDRKAFSNIMQ